MPALGGIPGVSAGQQMFWDGFQWVPRAGGETAGGNVDATRKLRRLYLGNLPYHLGVTEDSFSTQFYNTLKERGLCNDADQNPIQHVWFAREKGANYGFVEMASVEETERALGLDGLLVCGVPITIKRINDSVSPLASIGNVRPGQMPPGPGMPGSMLALPGVLATATSRIVVIKQILKYEGSTTEEDFKDVVEDMQEGCSAHGKLNKVLMIRPHNKAQLPGPEHNIGDVFLQCVSIEDATKIMRAMGHRKYDGRQIAMSSFDEDAFLRTVQAVIEG
jgi:splicing factor U2AF subunit